MIRKIISHPVFIVAVLIFSIHFFNVTQYEFMMEKDSYGWLGKYEEQITFESMQVVRPLFSVLASVLFHMTRLDEFTLFKYIFPLISIFAILPLWLLAREIKDNKLRYLIFLPLIFSPTIILQFEATRPQILAMLGLYFFISFLMLAFLKNNQVFFMLAGLVSVLAVFFHNVAFFFVISWTIALVWKFRRYIIKNWYRILFIAILAYPWFEIVQVKGLFRKSYTEILRIGNIVFNNLQTNLTFPSKYVNIDGIQAGWGGIWGISKYYAFYMGPLFFLLSVLILLFLLRNKDFRNNFFNICKSIYILPILLLFVFFLLLTEIFPRLLNLSYLPDRAWIFLGILSALFLFVFVKYLDAIFEVKRNFANFVFYLFVIMAIISMSGALYINDRFQYITTDDEMESFEWIRNNLEDDRVIFTCRYGGYLQYHSKSDVFKLDNCATISAGDLGSQIKGEEKLKMEEGIAKKMESYINEIDAKKSTLSTIRSKVKRRRIINETLIEKLDNYKESLDGLVSIIDKKSVKSVIEDRKPSHTYIYFSHEDPRNPYRVRLYDSGYSSSGAGRINSILIRDENYEKIYEKGSVIIWRYIGG